MSSCIGMLKHLRYLNLRCKRVEVLPRSITKLYNLETLILSNCYSLIELPKDFWKLISLRHLEINECSGLTCMPRGIGQLTNLQTLLEFGLKRSSKHSAEARELGELNKLRGKLKITDLNCLRHNPTAAKEMNLMGKPHLQTLILDWGYSDDNNNVEMEKDDATILEGLILHSNLMCLEIFRFSGVTFSTCIPFTNLKELCLESCVNLQYLPQTILLHVKVLKLLDLPCLEWIVKDAGSNGSSSTLSPSLTKIELNNLPNLKGWCRCSEEEMQSGSCHHQCKSLDRLCIDVCPNLISIPKHMNTKELQLFDVPEKILLQPVNHSKVESLIIGKIHHLKSLSGVLQNLTKVITLNIYSCYELDPCNDDDGCYDMLWKELKNVKHMQLWDLPKMKYLPEGLRHVTTLESLEIGSCINLLSLPEWVKSLQSLRIVRCPKLTYQPEGVEGNISSEFFEVLAE